MGYMGAGEAAQQWGISKRLVQRYCADGRVPGAKKQGNAWILPIDAAKPIDPRSAKPPLRATSVLMGGVPYRMGHLQETVEGLTHPGLRTQGRGELCYYSGRFEEALPLLMEAETYKELSVVSLAMQAASHISLGSFAGYRVAENKLRALKEEYEGDEASQYVVDLGLATISMSLYAPEQCPDWIAKGELFRLPPEALRLGAYVYAKYLHSQANNAQMLGVAEGVLLALGPGSCSVADIYLCMVCLLGCTALGQPEKAEHYARRALNMLLADGLRTPMAEYLHALQGMADKYLRESHPKEYAELYALWRSTVANWNIVHQESRWHYASQVLTLREYQTAMLASGGKTNAEIAKRLNISENSVKNYMKSVFQKMYITKRTELAGVFDMSKDASPRALYP